MVIVMNKLYIREKYLKKIRGFYDDTDMIKVITGVRRCGKSFLLFDLFYDYLLEQGIPEECIIRIALAAALFGNGVSFLYSLASAMGTGEAGPESLSLNERFFLAQFDTIRNLAASESCVIVGRCADYALAGMPGVVSVFVSADDEDKIKRLMETHNVTADKAREIMLKTDKRRSSYYNYYSNKRWGDSKSYDLCINSSKCTLEGAVDVILAYAEIAKKYRG